MKPKPISAAEAELRFVIVTMDSHLSSATRRAARVLEREIPGLELTIHAADQWSSDDAALARCRAALERAHIIVVTMLFMEEHFLPVIDLLRARQADCDALICAMSAAEVVRLTRMGRFRMDGSQNGALAFLKRLRGSGSGKPRQSAGAEQMRMLRRIPKLLRFIPGTAQDVRAYFVTLQYWLAGSEENIANLVRFLCERYASGPRARTPRRRAEAPIEYPEVGVYHPDLPARFAQATRDLPRAGSEGTVGLLLLRSYLLAGNGAHYDGVIRALEARGLRVIPAFAAGLDARPAIDRFFMKDGRPTIDALVSLTGFSLVGGPAYNDAKSAEEVLAALDVPYLAAQPVEFQTLEQWEGSDRGLLPVESTLMVAIPELDGATSPHVFGGRSEAAGAGTDMAAHPERAATLAARVARWVALRRTPRAEPRVGIVLFNFPPSAGNAGTAAFLAVFESLYH